MMLEQKATEFIEALSSSAPIPGGGGASAAVGALGAALGLMVTNLTVGKKTYADVEDEIKEVRSQLEMLRDELVRLVDADAEAFKPLSKAYGMPKETQQQKEEKERVMEEALYQASVVPMEIMETVLKTMELLRVLGQKGSKMAVSDVGVGILFAQAALEGASLNIFINTKSMKQRDRAKEMNAKAEKLIADGRALRDEVYADVLGKIK